MAITYSADTSGYVLNEYSKRRLDNGSVLVTAKHGGWAVLSPAEFRLFRIGRVEEDPNLQNLLIQQGLVVTCDNTGAITSNYRKKYAQLFEGTTLHILTPTLRCNQKCTYCYASSKPADAKEYDMEKKTARAVVDFILQCPAKSISIEFQGGEPLLNFPVVREVVSYALKKSKEVQKNVRFTLVTNLTLMDGKKMSFIKKNGIALNSSLDGPKRIHDKNRMYDGGGGTYDDVVSWVERIRERKIPIALMPTITRSSLPHWKEIIDEYVRLGMERFWVRKMNISGFALKNWRDIGYSQKEFFDFWKKCVEYLFRLNRRGIRIVEGHTEIILNKVVFSKSADGFLCMASPCGCAWGQTAYNYKGEIYACDEARSFDAFRLGNVHESSYRELYSSSKVMEVVGVCTGESLNCSACAYHPFCGPCIVDNYGESGNPIHNLGYSCAVKKCTLDYVFNDIIPDPEKRHIALGWTRLGESCV